MSSKHFWFIGSAERVSRFQRWVLTLIGFRVVKVPASVSVDVNTNRVAVEKSGGHSG